MANGESAKVIASKIPQELKSLKQWIVWKMIRRGNDLTKVPYQTNGKLASSTDRSTWTSFEEVEKAAPQYSGAGFVFSADDPYCGLDFDACRNPETGEVAKWAKHWIKKLGVRPRIS
jgi:putative DNA primase/helicase